MVNEIVLSGVLLVLLYAVVDIRRIGKKVDVIREALAACEDEQDEQ